MSYIEGNTLYFESQDAEVELLNKGEYELVLRNMLRENKAITALSFPCCRINDKALTIILNIIKNNKQITSLDISDNEFTDAGILSLAKMLPLTQLTKLNVRGNYKIEPELYVTLSGVVKNSAVNELDLSRIPLSTVIARIIRHLQGSKVTNLNLSTIAMGPDVAKLCSDNLEDTSIKILDVSSNMLGDEAATHFVRAAKANKLHTLNIGYNNLSGQFVQILAEISRDSTLTSIEYDGTILLREALSAMKLSEAHNNEHNNAGQLSNAFLAGYNLRLLENANKAIFLPAEIEERIAKEATSSATQMQALFKGWKAADMAYNRKSKL